MSATSIEFSTDYWEVPVEVRSEIGAAAYENDAAYLLSGP
jgi:hypothetical protein